MLQHLEAMARGIQQPSQQLAPSPTVAQARTGQSPFGASGMGYSAPHYGAPSAPQPYGAPPMYGAPAMTPQGAPAHPYYGAAQPGPSGGMYAPPPAAPPGQKPWLIPAIIGGGLFAALAIIGAAVALSPGDDGETASGASGAIASAKLGAMTGDDLRARLKKSGWNVTGEMVNNQTGFSMTSFTVQKLPQMASVNLYRYDDAYTASVLEGSLMTNGQGAVARDGTTILFVAVVPQDPLASRQLLGKLTR
jgi:hypothetical protein